MKPAVIDGRTIYTYEDYAALPEEGKHHEVIGGELFVTPAPATIHQAIVFLLARILCDHAEQQELGAVYISPIDVVLTRSDVVQPDIVFVAKDRLAIIGEKFIDGPPDLAIEVLSPQTRRLDLGKKKRLYEREGVRFYWTVDPAAHTITEWALDDHGRYKESRSAKDDAGFRSTLFPKLSIPLKKLWA